VTAHAHGAEGIKNAVRAGVQSIEHGSLMDDEAIRLMKEGGVYLVADIYNGDYIAREGRRQGWPEEFLRKNDETTEAARNIGWEERVGSLASGKYADLVAVEGDALADLSSFGRVAFVMKGGVVVKGP